MTYVTLPELTDDELRCARQLAMAQHTLACHQSPAQRIVMGIDSGPDVERWCWWLRAIAAEHRHRRRAAREAQR